MWLSPAVTCAVTSRNTDGCASGSLPLLPVAEHRVKAHKPEGAQHNRWVVIDYFDVIVHVMDREIREKYDLEGLWNDAAAVESVVLEN